MTNRMLAERLIFEEEDILRLIEEKQYAKLKEYLTDTNDVDIAEILNDIEDPTKTLLIFRMLPKASASIVFAYLDLESQKDILAFITEKELKAIMDELYFDDIIDLIEEMPGEFVDKIIKNISKEERALVNQFLRYPEDSAGSLMTIEYVSFNKNYTVERAMEYLREVGIKKEQIYSSYVVDNNRRLIGLVSLRKLVTSDRNLKLEDIMEEDIIFLNTNDDQELVSEMFQKYGFIAMPVVDKTHRLVGIVTIDDVIEVIQEEDTEDFQMMAAITPNDDVFLETNALELAKNRIPWLLLLLISATLSGLIINSNLTLLGDFAILATLIPMLTGTGGNASSQSSTLIIRGLATGDVEEQDAPKILIKEVSVSAIISAVLVIVLLVRVLLIQGQSMQVAMTVCLTLIFTVFMSNIVGGILPILAKKFNLDPAIMAVPLITTIVDASSLLIYFCIAESILL